MKVSTTIGSLKRLLYESIFRRGWIKPDGKFVDIRGDMHCDWAKRHIFKDEPHVNPDKVYDMMFDLGWVRVASASMYEGPHPRDLNIDQLRTIVRMLPVIGQQPIYEYKANGRFCSSTEFSVRTRDELIAWLYNRGKRVD